MTAVKGGPDLLKQANGVTAPFQSGLDQRYVVTGCTVCVFRRGGGGGRQRLADNGCSNILMHFSGFFAVGGCLGVLPENFPLKVPVVDVAF